MGDGYAQSCFGACCNVVEEDWTVLYCVALYVEPSYRCQVVEISSHGAGLEIEGGFRRRTTCIDAITIRNLSPDVNFGNQYNRVPIMYFLDLI